MEKRILITGLDSKLKARMIKLFLDGNFQVAATISKMNINDKKVNKNLLEIPWNNRSPLSAKDIILECRNKMDGFDNSLTVFSSQQNNKPIHDSSSADIENVIDTNIKGNIFILKEIILYFQKQGKGNISLIHDIEQSEIVSPLNAVETGGFSSLANSLFAFYQNENLAINSFKSNSSEWEDYAEYIYKNISERENQIHGKVFKFPERGVLNAFNISKKH